MNKSISETKHRDHLCNLIFSNIISPRSPKLHKKVLTLSSQSTLIVLLQITPLYLNPVLCLLIFNSCSAFLLSSITIDTVTLSSFYNLPPNTIISHLFQDLNMFGYNPNLQNMSLLIGIFDHSSVSIEQIQGGTALPSISILPGSSNFLVPPNLRIYLFLYVVKECLELLVFKECMMYTCELQAGTNFQHRVKHPSLSFSPPTIYISPPNSQILKNLRSVSIDLTALKLSSMGLEYSHLMICLDVLAPQPKMQQQLLDLKNTDCGIPRHQQSYCSGKFINLLISGNTFLSILFISLVIVYRTVSLASCLKMCDILQSQYSLCLLNVNICFRCCQNTTTIVSILSSCSPVLKFLVFFMKIQLKQLSQYLTSCNRSLVQYLPRLILLFTFNFFISYLRTFSLLAMISSNSSNFYLTCSSYILLMSIFNCSIFSSISSLIQFSLFYISKSTILFRRQVSNSACFLCLVNSN